VCDTKCPTLRNPQRLFYSLNLTEGRLQAAGESGGLQRLCEAREAMERDLIQGALDRHQGHVASAAEELGLNRAHLHRRIHNLGLDRA